MKNSRIARLTLVGVLVCLSRVVECAGQGTEVPEPGQVLEKLAAFDKAFVAAITVQGEVLSSGSAKQGMKLHFTCDGERTGIEELRPAPPYTPAALQQARPEGNGRGRPGVSVDAQFSYDAEGNLRMRSTGDKQLLIFNKEQSAQMLTTVGYLIAPDGRVLEQNDTYHRIDRVPAESVAFVLPRAYVLSCLGRGFTAGIKKVTKVEAVGSAMLRVTADGVSTMETTGTWTLLVDPSLSYMVREASFVEAGKATPRIVIDNEGLDNEGKMPVPHQGTFSVTLAGTMVVYQVKIDKVDFKFDPEFYARIEAAVTGKPPANSNVYDRRASPPSTQRVDANGKVSGGR
jgi:hypothetical protein